MPDLYFFIVVVLFALAITDLIVGVSNDAVNFLNSAIGSQVASRRIILIVASLGVFIGATFSSGMMEIARKGIFNPDQFLFAEVMVIFAAVMLTDIILLDIFNTFGLPTSTTVSIVFELLGASVIVALIKMSGAGEGLSQLSQYINSASALAIISGIFASIVVAFSVGTAVQYFSRVLFSFHYEKRMKYIGALWAGFSLAVLTYFLLVKGVKGASFISKETMNWFQTHTLLIFLGSFLGWTIVLQILYSFFKVNILKIIVLFGTFALAMAFAGNDLVNFIGVPIAGFESFLAWKASGLGEGEMLMENLRAPVRTNTYLLLLAGLVMVVTLWFSRKAQSVTETEVNLGRQDEGLERFPAHPLSRAVVRGAIQFGKAMGMIMPRYYFQKTAPSFTPSPLKPLDPQASHPPAFDLVRASVNLTVASMLIAFATSLKLPLSTTYVSFMVAMGTSLADRAWGRDSAVYRVTGVLSVITGWFGTAIIAFTAAGIFALLIYYFGGWAIGGLLGLAIFLIYRSFSFHRKQEIKKKTREAAATSKEKLTAHDVEIRTLKQVADTLSTIRKIYKDAIGGLLSEDRDQLTEASEKLNKLRQQNEDLRFTLLSYLRRIEEKNGSKASELFLLVYDLEEEILKSVSFIVESCSVHVLNLHEPLKEKQELKLRRLEESVVTYLESVVNALRQHDFETLTMLKSKKKEILVEIEAQLAKQVEGVKSRDYGSRNSLLFFTILLETKDMVAVAGRFVKMYRRALQKEEGPLFTSSL